MNPEPQISAAEYYVLKHGNTYGPFHQREILVGLESGQFAAGDFVQIGGHSRWEPIGSVSGETTEAAADSPPWDTILKVGWLRLRTDIEVRPFEAGAICLGAGAACMILANWRFLFWIPWFAGAAATGVALLRRKRMTHGALLLLAALCIPLAVWIFPLKHAPRSTKPLPVSLPPVSSPKSPAQPTPAALEKAAPASIPGLSPGADAAPNTPASAGDSGQERPSAPAPVAITPHYGRQTPEPPVAKSPTAAPASSTAVVALGTGEQTPSNSGKPSSLSILGGPGGNSNPPENAKPDAKLDVKPDANELASVYAASLVLAKGDQGAGSGFICKSGTGAVLYTNIHVVAGLNALTFTSTDGVVFSPGQGGFAAGRDLVRFEVTPVPQKPLEVITDFDSHVRIGDAVAVLGNSGGEGVVTALPGVVNGIGPDRIEVSAKMIPGNSGSPIVHIKTGKVIGIATYLVSRSADPKKGMDASIRRFGYRIDNASTWEPVNWPVFRFDAQSIKKITLMTEDLVGVMNAYPNVQSMQIRDEGLRRASVEWSDAMRSVKFSERNAATESFLRELKFLSNVDVSAVERQITYTYFRDELTKQRKIRDQITALIDRKTSMMPSSLSSSHH